jgi:Flp pilus assembly CpaE family ATPase
MAQIRILLVEDDEDDFTLTQELLGEVQEHRFDLVWARSYEEAVREIARGRFDVYLVDYRLGARTGLDLLRGELQEGRLGPVIILTGHGTHEVDVAAMRHGASGYLVKGELRARELERTLRYAIERHAATMGDIQGGDLATRPKRGRVVSFLGSKGGVGTTTVTANVAAALANRGLSVVTIDMRGDYGPLARLLNVAPLSDISRLLALDASAIDVDAFEQNLSMHSSGLRVLASPHTPGELYSVRADQAAAITEAAARNADLIIVDLPAGANEANRAVLRASDLIGLVVDREPSSVVAARLLLTAMRAWRVEAPVGSVVLSKVALAEAVSATEVNTLLGLKKYGIIPPAPELFYRAALSLNPVILSNPTHPAAKALDELALCLLLIR